MTYGKAILGDNQFLGVNHSDQSKAGELYRKFSDPDAILEIINVSYEAGIRDFMFTTHDRYEEVFKEIKRSNMFKGMYYTPCLPYAHKYWNKLSAQGPISLLMSTILQVNPINVTPALLSTLFGRTGRLIALLTEIETLMCRGLPVRGIFLQNLAFDLLLAMEAYSQIEDFSVAVTKKLGVMPGFITMNHSKATEVLCDKIGLQRPWLCANYNLAGFRMNPSRAEVISSFSSHKTRNIAMSVFSSGSASGEESLDFVVSQLGSGVDALIFGSSNPANIIANTNFILGNNPTHKSRII